MDFEDAEWLPETEECLIHLPGIEGGGDSDPPTPPPPVEPPPEDPPPADPLDPPDGGGDPSTPPSPPGPEEGETDEDMCGDERDDIIEEYVRDILIPASATPECADFRSNGGTVHFTWSELNDGWSGGSGHPPWGMVRGSLTSGLEATRSAYNRGGIKLTSGYRCPHGNDDIGGAKNSPHVHGAAADMYSADHPWTEEEFDLLRVAAESTGASTLPWERYTDRHLHAEWW